MLREKRGGMETMIAILTAILCETLTASASVALIKNLLN